MEALNKKLLRQRQYPISLACHRETYSLSFLEEKRRGKIKKKDDGEETREECIIVASTTATSRITRKRKGRGTIYENNFVGDIQGHHLPSHV